MDMVSFSDELRLEVGTWEGFDEQVRVYAADMTEFEKFTTVMDFSKYLRFSTELCKLAGGIEHPEYRFIVDDLLRGTKRFLHREIPEDNGHKTYSLKRLVFDEENYAHNYKEARSNERVFAPSAADYWVDEGWIYLYISPAGVNLDWNSFSVADTEDFSKILSIASKLLKKIQFGTWSAHYPTGSMKEYIGPWKDEFASNEEELVLRWRKRYWYPDQKELDKINKKMPSKGLYSNMKYVLEEYT